MSEPSRIRYGTTNPERVTNSLWELSQRHDWSGARLREHLGIAFESCDFGRDFSLSSYREAVPGPFWSWRRFGRTSTRLADGRVIHIGGEHEDCYDVDFCIYNDVVIEHANGRLEFLLYPKDVFPPTDFHSATQVGDVVILIGSLGYRDLRRIGHTQVLALDCETFRIEPLAGGGDEPGWISRHEAELISERTIRVTGGKIQTSNGLEAHAGTHEFDVATRTWRF